MEETHALVDYENVQPSNDELSRLLPSVKVIWLFYGPNQTKRAEDLAAVNGLVTLVPLSRKGPNALDFQLAFYLGYVAAKHPTAQLVVVANDKGYDPMIAHGKILGFSVKRIGYKAKKPAVKIPAKVKQMKSVVKKPTQVIKTKATAGAALVAKRSSPKILVSPAKVKIEPTGNKRARRAVPAKKQTQSKFPVDPELQLVSKIKKAFEKM